MIENEKLKLPQLLLSVFLTVIVGSISGFFTAGEIDTWYATLEKPALNPPNWIFGPVWTFLYILIGVALYFYLVTPSSNSKRMGYQFFAIQLLLNFLWSLFFFKMQSPLLALVDIFLLIADIVVTMFYFGKVRMLAALLMIPYLAWVCFATYLNLGILRLN